LLAILLPPSSVCRLSLRRSGENISHDELLMDLGQLQAVELKADG